MTKLIIDNRSSLKDATVLYFVNFHMRQDSVVKGRNYLAGAAYTTTTGEILIFHEENKNSERFIVTDGRDC